MQKLALIRKNRQTGKLDFFAGYDSDIQDCLRWSSFDFAWKLEDFSASQLLDYISMNCDYNIYDFFTKSIDFSS